ncbi:hypothetical protein IWQ62_003875 [Dispira parvispora]|uniref:F-box domain-containing protein n=1 Tax=Dispira parvispora TaxID=1520584 RepID=A0A9W8ATF4_9FUNG|nr:hypothetical protein IWQ62_003875 [Dispira parvispora]
MATNVSLPHLDQGVIQNICRYLTVPEILTLARVNKTLYIYCHQDSLWQKLTQAAFGNTQWVIGFLREAGLCKSAEDSELTPALQSLSLATSIPEEGATSVVPRWKQAYERRWRVQNRPQDPTVVQSMQLAQTRFERAEQRIEASYEKPADQQLAFLEEAARELVEVVDILSDHAPSYYLLALVCYLLHAFKQASKLAEMCLALDPDFELAIQLLSESRDKSVGVYGTEGVAPLLTGRRISDALKNALTVLFQRYDRDRDGVWNIRELREFVLLTNGTNPSLAMLQQLCATFSSQPTKGLTFDGLCEFFVQQSLQDHEETRQDLAKHGFDENTLTLK